jgi:hypothetical protein
MLSAIRAFEGGEAFIIDVVDVDADDVLQQQYDELVPVLLGQKDGQEPMQICHYFLDADALRDFIDGVAPF